LYKLKNIALVGLFIGLAASTASAQQDPMFTKYMFNRLAFNPAAAGSNEHLAITLIHRQQWIGLEGAPVSQAFNAHTPLPSQRAAVGFSLVNDKVGATGFSDMAFSYAYRTRFRADWQLSLGLQGSVANWRANWSELILENNNDPTFPKNGLNRWAPNFGAGVELQHERFYFSLGVPRLIEYNLREVDVQKQPIFGQNYRHLYGALGAAFPLKGKQIVFRPFILFKTAGLGSSTQRITSGQTIGTPAQVDVDLSLFLYETFWVGAAVRTALQANGGTDSADLWVAWHMRNGMRLGFAYDIGLGALQRLSNGSVELLVGYEFDIKTRKVVTPRYF
jgi:type IX secretion system PorP/SprF family membrane protein